jgi:2-polyprenyl-3-methyl-5-hydroxy-6-metoxy-1,4-benzoquinol methylase
VPLLRLTPPLPRHLAARHRALDANARTALHYALSRHYFADARPDYLASDAGRSDLDDHLEGRLAHDRERVVPWLDAARPLAGARILEVGCGTGSATVALAEQGSVVTGLDLCERSIQVARRRCELYGLEASFVVGNAVELLDKLRDEQFDFVIFFASLEHMTFPERKGAMRLAWELLDPGELFCVVETPSRLWFHDAHTSLLPFFHWLPDDVAFEYSRKSPRENFRERYRELDEESMLHFLRRGRGVSHHDFELAIGPAHRLDVVSSLTHFHRARHRFPFAPWLRRRRSTAYRYERLLAQIAPELHPGFLQPQLDLVIRKPR